MKKSQYMANTGYFNPQRMLDYGNPDFMRDIGYNSTGGYPIEQAPWMAGPTIPDFMALGGGGPMHEFAIARDARTGHFALYDRGFPYVKGLGYYDIPTTLEGVGGIEGNKGVALLVLLAAGAACYMMRGDA